MTTIPDLFSARVEATPEALAFAQPGDRATWREAHARVHGLASRLVELGVRPGDRVAVLGPTSGEWMIADLAILSAGAVCVGIYPTLSHDQIAYIVKDSGARVGFACTPADTARLRDAGVATVLGWEETRRGGESRALPVRAPNDLALLIYTSGTTGTPKGAMLSHRACVFQARALAPVFPASTADRTVAFLPLAHVAEHVMASYGRLVTGMTAHYVGSMESDAVLRAVAEVRPTVFGSVPRLFEKAHAKLRATIAASPRVRRQLFAWAEQRGRARRDAQSMLARLQLATADRLVLSKVRERFGGAVRYFVSGSAAIDPAILELFDACGMPVLEGYGLTECGGFCTANRLGAVRYGTVGTPVDGYEVRIAADGEVLVRSEGLFDGYLGDPELTARTLVDGWLHTGDIGELDSQGYLRITDRKKNLLVTSGGKKVAPTPIESLLASDPLFGAAMVIGERRPYLTALLVLDRTHADAGSEQTVTQRARAVAHQANTRLARFEQIRKLRIIDRELAIGSELTPTLKLRRAAVEQRFAAEIESLYNERSDPHIVEIGDASSG